MTLSKEGQLKLGSFERFALSLMVLLVGGGVMAGVGAYAQIRSTNATQDQELRDHHAKMEKVEQEEKEVRAALSNIRESLVRIEEKVDLLFKRNRNAAGNQ